MKQVFYFLLLILVIVSVHEFGHYLMARVFKVKVQRFSIGLG
ncbi:MAG: RIP metalloprotease RseP, partial [Haemophilus parainfluenzae]